MNKKILMFSIPILASAVIVVTAGIIT
ncbi:hypothetical protein LCGC14_2498350, partial [marine sediment metagenome]